MENDKNITVIDTGGPWTVDVDHIEVFFGEHPRGGWWQKVIENIGDRPATVTLPPGAGIYVRPVTVTTGL